MPIAIIGMSCRLPGGATDPDKLWDLCVAGKSAWSEIPESRFNRDAWYHPDKEHIGTSYVKGGYFLSQDLSTFDAAFFNFTSETATTMDPEVRMQLECTYEALESAGLTMEDVAGSKTAVCAGTCFRDFHDNHMRDPSTLARSFLTGNGMAMISNRVSHFFDLRGPSIAVDTGCSTTLTLLHLACQSLRSGEADMAIVGGSNLLVNPDMFISGTILGLLSAEGKCFAFDSRASGYGRGEGIATLVLKPLDLAVRDGDPIRAVIRETGANQDGKTPTLTSPNREAQEQLMRECYARAGLDPRDTGYVEAHGTGTQAGDTNEANAIGHVLGAGRHHDDPLLVGSVKTNIGHTEATSGLAGIIKAVMAIEKGSIPPNLNFDQPNSKIPFQELGIKIPTSVENWPKSAKLRASVNNFGYGGSNAHVILEHPEYLLSHFKAQALNPRSRSSGASKSLRKATRILRISSKDEGSTKAQFENIQRYASEHLKSSVNKISLLDRLLYTYGQKRSHFPWTYALTVSALEDIIEAQGCKAQRASRAPRIGFVFSGQGAQWFAMGRELIQTYPVFRDALQEADNILCQLGASWSLIGELLQDEHKTRINEVIISLPASVALQLALVCLLRSWGIKPSGVTGHSSGEVAAAFAVGAIDMRSALAIVYTRGSLTTDFQRIVDRKGGMLAVGLSRDECIPYIGTLKTGEVVVACVNSPSSVTISGDLAAIEELEQALIRDKVFCRRLRVDAAYHSHHMFGIADAYRVALSQELRTGREFDSSIIYSSPVTGDRIESKDTISSPEHWVRNMVQPVEFLDCLSNMCQDASGAPTIDILLEIGPAAALQGPIRQILSMEKLQKASITYLPCLRRGQDAVSTMQEMACTLIGSGAPVRLGSINFPHGSNGLQVLTDLDTYPWNHHISHWAESRMSKTLRGRELPVHDLLGTPTLDSNPFSKHWRHIIRPSEIPWVREHKFQSNIIYPGAGYVSMAIEACRQSHGFTAVSSYELHRIEFKSALVVPDSSTGVEVQLCLNPCTEDSLEPGWEHFRIMSIDDSSTWTLHCEGDIIVNPTGPSTNTAAARPDNPTIRTVEPKELYASLQRTGLDHGPIFQNISAIRVGDGVSICDFDIAKTSETMPLRFQQKHVLHPTTLDSVFQAVFTALLGDWKDSMLPRSIKSLRITSGMSAVPETRLSVSSVVIKSSAQGFESDATVVPQGTSPPYPCLLEVKGLYCQALGSISRAITQADETKLCFKGTWKPDVRLLDAEQFVYLVYLMRGGLETSKSLRTLASLLLHKTPRLRVLSIDAGNHLLGNDLLNMFASSDLDQNQITWQLTYTESSLVEPEAGEIFAASGVREFETITWDTCLQTRAAYDLIMIPNGLSNADLACAKAMLKPGGGILMTRDNMLADLEASCQILDLGRADGHTIVFASPDNPLMISKPIEIFLVYTDVAPSLHWLDTLQKELSSRQRVEVSVICQKMDEISGLLGKDVILLENLDRPLLMNPTSDQFESIKTLLIGASSLFWISQGATVGCTNPFAAMHLGLLRTLRCEQPFNRYISLDLDSETTTYSLSDALCVAKVLQTTLTRDSSDETPMDVEYAVREGLVCVQRVEVDTVMNQSMLEGLPKSVPFLETKNPIRLGVERPGLLDSLVFIDDDSISGSFPPDAVQIRPAAFGLNFRDVMVAMGQLDETRMGFECSGYITAVGSEAASRGFQIGDKVYAFLRGYFGNTIRVHHTSVAKIPPGVDLETAASIPLVFITAYHALHNMARLCRGETVLIHSGMGGVGQAAIMLAQNVGAEIFVTVGSEEKRARLMATYSIPEDHILNSRNASFAKDVMDATGGKGIDVILNSLAGPLLAASWDCIAAFGRFIEIGKRDLELNKSLRMAPFVRSASFAALDLITLGELRGDVVADIFTHINILLQTHAIRPVSPISKFAISDAESAYRMMQAGRHMGKILLVPSENEHVQLMSQPAVATLSAEHSYLLIGGLGGIGRSITDWMVSRGAKHLILLSRSADSLDQTTCDWLAALHDRQVEVHTLACDVSDENQLSAVLGQVKDDYPPIRGIVQAAMVLRDVLFENMTLVEYEAAVRPKVQGTWNLHRCVPDDLDFFIILSSISAFGGNATQANYAAAGTFQDALAHHRTATGQPTVSINLGMVKDVGVLAGEEGRRTADRLQRIGLRALDQTEVLRLIEASICQGKHGTDDTQIVTGIPHTWTRQQGVQTREMQATAQFWTRDPRFASLEASPSEAGIQDSNGKMTLTDILGDVSLNEKDAAVALTESLVSKLAAMFAVPESDIDTSVPLSRLGIDSLLAVELRNWISAVVRADCSVFDILQAPSIVVFSEQAVAKSTLRSTQANGS
ncbi:hypothetical protein AUEXF2481DRAFT_71742 [Aureobasidium subglaciale EXF-2481]|uniref:Uncharacterized protein n=1 Tax=Aureobasidium subglaciale (strain EXF-2481) TaxID=1043005 RepID=A0A074XXC2_AURSE|nr:uncharacterized protein AUEXF2481DRAFT_71742 [Aureobasidium subglaciale EXF-2481]KEQ90223.1 hypothetical protein AUEXF2481DRAFT_71742 [Aureobasidium subglaciale EXF-2481]